MKRWGLVVLLLFLLFLQSTRSESNASSALEGDGYRLVQVGDMPLFVRVHDPENKIVSCYFDRAVAQEILCVDKDSV